MICFASPLYCLFQFAASNAPCILVVLLSPLFIVSSLSSDWVFISAVEELRGIQRPKPQVCGVSNVRVFGGNGSLCGVQGNNLDIYDNRRCVSGRGRCLKSALLSLEVGEHTVDFSVNILLRWLKFPSTCLV